MAHLVPVDSGTNAPILKWAQLEPGHVEEGEYIGVHEGKYGVLVDLETKDGPLAIPMKVSLERQLARVRVGAYISIRFDGLQRNARSGRDFYACKVFTAEADLLPAPKRQRDDEVKL
jgi:hypothetical protein